MKIMVSYNDDDDNNIELTGEKEFDNLDDGRADVLVNGVLNAYENIDFDYFGDKDTYEVNLIYMPSGDLASKLATSVLADIEDVLVKNGFLKK